MPQRSLILVAQQVAAVRSGVGTFARILVRGLARAGARVAVATWSDEIDPSLGVDWIDLGPRPRLDPTPGAFWSLGRRAAAALAASRCDVLHFLDAREAHALEAPPRGAALVGTVHDDYAAHASRNPLRWLGRAADPWRRCAYYAWLYRLERRAFRRFDRLLANSRATAASLAERYDVPADHIGLLPLCAEGAPAAASPARLPGDPALLFVGGNFYRKGLDVLVGALARLVAAGSGAILHVAGQDPARRRLQRLADRLGVGRRLRFHGRVAPAEVAALMAGASLLVMPSRREALGLVYLEAFRAGLPVVAGRDGGVGDLVVDGETGLQVAAEDEDGLVRAITAIGADAQLRARLVAGGRALLAERSEERLVADTLAAYETALAKGSGSGAGVVLASQRSPVKDSSSTPSLAPIARGEKLCS